MDDSKQQTPPSAKWRSTPITTNPTLHTVARIALLDALFCAVETTPKSPSARALLGLIISGTTVPHGFPVPDPVKSIFNVGLLIRYLDHNDASWDEKGGFRNGRFGGRIEDEGLMRGYLEVGKGCIAAGVVVRLKDGRALEEVLVEFPVGHVRKLRMAEEVRRKFARNMRLVLTEDIGRIMEVI
ncbi:hypothetical protein AnigIFM60653_008096 [Aspergillus niger]|nr:hypothetical protein AnigIFM50267_006968 [Aspergillus niger]GLA07144.1 hypothetical protein AnigIFM60653_008096 [Aspergillus niger]